MDVERLSPKQRGWRAAPGRCSAASTPEPLAVSHRPKAVPARVCECCGLTQDESAFVEGRNDRRG